ncbi:MAG: carbohydrate kinase family protein [Phaeodactylibacter sp.]|nr:carbohydrate kinase family protein [Phaeodactylibacter sp.]MCB9265678.1 carbohydrate kinase family protein [Lewinellaceae bacterium]MCB9288383.1 carbohydrate kinase family protein [Lewinellaceae bacterium]
MKREFQVAILGPIPYDHITTSKGQVIVKYGCVTHPAIALSRLLEGKGKVFPVTHIRKKDDAGVRTLFSGYENIGMDGVYSHLDQGDVIQLRFIDQNNRLEKQTAFMPPIRPEDIAPLIHCDVFVCVPISDYEVPLETLQYIKANRKENAITIFDAHGPTTTVTTNGDRLRRFWVERDLWLPYIDILKMNIEEAGCCWFKKEYKAEELKEDYTELSESEMAEFAIYSLQRGVKAVVITLDSRGCMAYSMPNGQFKAEFIPSVRVKEVIDTTGCGDSFAGGLAFGLLEGQNDYIRAAQYANALGALRTQGTTFEVFRTLEETNEIIRRNYEEQARV